MKAAVITKIGGPLEIQSFPDPKPGPKSAVIKVAGCGVCRSDWHMWQGDWTWIGIQMNLPQIIGHEVSGVVEEVGKDVKNFKHGDRVTLPFHMACGECHYCYTGKNNLCMAHGTIGGAFAGGYGSHSVIPAADINLVHLPEEVDLMSAAALGCRYMTSYHGIVNRAKVLPGEWVVVFGMGGVGLSAVQIASAIGAQVVAVTRSKDKLEMAMSEGAHHVVQSGSDKDVAGAVKEITNGGADVTVDAFGGSEPTLQGLMSLKKGGRHVQLGLTGKEDAGNISMPVDMMTAMELSFVGSLGCPTTSYPGLINLTAKGTLNPKKLITKTIGLEEINGVLNDMTDFNVSGFKIIKH